MNGTPHEFDRRPRSPGDVDGWSWFCAWTAVGAAVGLGAVSLGPIALGPAIVVAALMCRSHDARRSAFGILTGIGLLLLVVAWVNREGPGPSCWHTATAGGCGEHLSPIPWLILGIVLVVAGAIGQRRSRRGRHEVSR